MKKTLNIAWKISLILLIVVTIIGGTVLYVKRDEIVTSKITMKYFSKVVNNNDKEAIKSFVADSKDDALYVAFENVMNNIYHFEGVTDFNFKIIDSEVFGDGKYQCYFSTAFENYVPKCDLNNEQRYMNYLIDAEVSYKFNGEQYNNKEKGLVVFVKDMTEGNYFTWKLVGFDRYKISD